MTTAILETTARPTTSNKPRRPRNGRSSNRAGSLGLKPDFTLSATELGHDSVEVFFGQIGLTVTSRNEDEAEALLEGTLALARIDALFDALPESVRLAALEL